MQSSNRPRRLVQPFGAQATSGYIRTVPDAAATGGAASYAQGFPPATFQPVASGGTPPSGQDMNGVLFDLSGAARWAASGGMATYDASYATAIGGYPLGARLVSSANPLLVWVSTVDNNTANPDATGATGWTLDGAAGANLANAGGHFQQGALVFNFGNVLLRAGDNGHRAVTFDKPFATAILALGATNDAGGSNPSAWVGVGLPSLTGMSVGMSVPSSAGSAGIPAAAGTAAWWWALGV